MQKKLLKTAVVSSLTFVFAQANIWPAQTFAAAPASIAQESSFGTFRTMMNDPALNELHLRAQKARIKTEIDRNMENYFSVNPLTPMALPALTKQLGVDVAQETNTNLMGSELITAESNPFLRARLEQVMRIQGFSDKEIKNAKFFKKMGEVNAYAYTFDGVGFVLLTGLEDIAARQQLMGVFGHELGHIRSGHILLGVLNQAMELRLIKFLLTKNEDEDSTDADEVKLNRIADQFLSKKTNSLSKGLRTNRIGKATINGAVKKFAFSATPFGKELEGRILAGYVDQIIQNLDSVDVPKKYVQQFINFKNLLDPNNPSLANTTELMEALSVWEQAYSREMETSADYFGDIVVRPSKAAMMDAKFSGRKIPAKPSPKDIQGVVKSAIAQVIETQSQNTQDDYSLLIGGPDSADHPLSNLRILRQAAFDRDLDRVALANPFLRIVVDLDQAREEQAAIAMQIAKFETLIDQANEKNDSHKTIAMYKKNLNTMMKVSAETEKNISKIAPLVTKLLNDPGLVLKNPRLTDLLDYRLAQKQLIESKIAFIESLPEADANDKAMKKQAIVALNAEAKQISQDPTLKTADSVALAVRKASSNSNDSAIIDQALKALGSEHAEDTLKARQALATLSTSPSRIALEVQPKLKSSDAIVRAPFKQDSSRQSGAASLAPAARFCRAIHRK